MANVTIDLGAVLEQIRTMVGAIVDEHRADKERRTNAQNVVYYALSIHPALDYMHPPTGVLADVDWYQELRSTWKTGIFRTLGQNQHFKRCALLGQTGSRARIMLLLLWIIGHRLDDDHIYRLLSTAVDDALKSQDGTSVQDGLTRLQSVTAVLVDLRSMIKSRLPLPADRNPFMGHDYRKEDEEKALPREELWGYELSEEEQYLLDVRRNPSQLLQKLEKKVVIPENKLTLLLIQWATSNFGLGKKVYSRDDIDPQAFWNADPPGIEDEHAYDWSSDSASMNFDGGYAFAPYDYLYQDIPLSPWLHERYCHVYEVHGWVHDRLARVLLFNAYCDAYSLPSDRDIMTAMHVARRLRTRVSDDIWDYMVPFIIARCLFAWFDAPASSSSEAGLTAWSKRDRSLTAIFADVIRWQDDQPITPPSPRALEDIKTFLVYPARVCAGAFDVLSLPLIRQTTSETLDDEPFLPSLSPNACTCGKCHPISDRSRSTFEFFKSTYFTLMDEASSRGCYALRDAWEPTLREAESWFEELEGRVASSFTPFPWSSEQRLGPLILEILRTMGISANTEFSDEDLLRLITAMSSQNEIAAAAVPKSLPAVALGYVVKLPITPDREDYCAADANIEPVIFAKGDWLYAILGSDGVHLVYSDENISIIYYSLAPNKFAPVCMAESRFDSIHLPPPFHADRNSRAVDLADQETEVDFQVNVTLSNLMSHGFPLLSVANPELPSGSHAAMAALIRVTCLGREVETIWRPEVYVGSECDHKGDYNRMTHCAPTAFDILLQTPPAGNQEYLESSWSVLFQSEKSEKACREVLNRWLDRSQRSTAGLRQPGSPVERNRACIIRCGARDGPLEPIVVLAASLRKRVYKIHRRQCWSCALVDMQTRHCTIGLAPDIKAVSGCQMCRPAAWGRQN